MPVNIPDLLGANAKSLLEHTCQTISKEHIHLPGHDFVDRIFAQTNRSPQVLRSLQQLYNTGRLAGTGYMS
ncbi:MAG: fructose-bisphosphate aldolase, partial [Sphingobacteriia bacterium]|nr:fructose-bisphosphate aldolase [Sphingobacteriia bacterium]